MLTHWMPTEPIACAVNLRRQPCRYLPVLLPVTYLPACADGCASASASAAAAAAAGRACHVAAGPSHTAALVGTPTYMGLAPGVQPATKPQKSPPSDAGAASASLPIAVTALSKARWLKRVSSRPAWDPAC